MVGALDGPIRQRERKPAVATTWTTVFDLETRVLLYACRGLSYTSRGVLAGTSIHHTYLRIYIRSYIHTRILGGRIVRVVDW